MNVIRCSKCQSPQPLESFASGQPFACARCRTELRVSVFSAIHRGIGPGLAAEVAQLDGEATCFFHANKKAAAVCDGCGRFLCSLCDVPLRGQHLCPKCVETGREKKTLPTLESYRTSYPSLAKTFAFVPILFWPITLVTAPLTVFLVLYGWNKPPSLTGHKRRAAMVISLLAALVQCALWVIFGVKIYEGVIDG